ncbi:MAG TPA: class I SAM-dependent methyltransferase [Vicinamibacterales bacterium]
MGWLPRFACPGCRVEIPVDAEQSACGCCGRRYIQRGGIWRFLDGERLTAVEPFVRHYRAVRGQEGRRQLSIDYYRHLPSVPLEDPHAREWRIRRETYGHLLRQVLSQSRLPSTILDLGAGSGWLSHRMAALGHLAVAVDILDDEADGLGVVERYDAPVVAVQADFDALPFAPQQFDTVIFNGSLHYAPDPYTTLARVQALLTPGGTLVVMDSPMFASEGDGTAMVADAVRRFTNDLALQDHVTPGLGYLTFRALAASARTLQMSARFVPSRGWLAWRVQRNLARLRLGRQPAAFGLWVAR